jgi:hypothetical protein
MNLGTVMVDEERIKVKCVKVASMQEDDMSKPYDTA